MIPCFIEEANINFYSCKCIPYYGKKLLTFSSIVFLQHINKLDVVLKQENIFVPKSVFLYIKDAIESIEKSGDENYYLRSHGFIKKDMTKIKNKLQLILKMLNSNQIIDDTKGFISLCDELDIDTQKELILFYICLLKQYQLITEDRFFGYLAERIKAPQIVSNAMSLLIKEKDYIDKAILLDSKKYSYVFGEYMVNNINAACLYKDISSYNISNRDKQMLQIIDKYGFLDELKQYYKNTYKVLYPKINLPKDDYVKHNI